MNDEALEAALFASRRSKCGHRRIAEPDYSALLLPLLLFTRCLQSHKAEQNQKKPAFDALPKPDKFIRYRHVAGERCAHGRVSGQVASPGTGVDDESFLINPMFAKSLALIEQCLRIYGARASRHKR
jgi:hypothetical protein